VRKPSRVVAAAVLAALALSVTGAISVAQPKPSLQDLIAQAKKLETQINSLSEQYDGLRIQLGRAKTDEKIAQQAAKRADAALRTAQSAISQLAADNYMGSGVDPTMQVLGASDPAQFLQQASAIAEINQTNGDRVSQLAAAQHEAQRAEATARQQIANVQQIQSQMDIKKKAILTNIDKVNNAAMAQAMSIYTQTGHYPQITLPTATTVGEQALQNALTKQGDAYTWGAAGPSLFDCSGLVVWAFGQLGISLPHYTGDLWNSGVHVSQSQLEPGDLVFFFADLSHVGIYVGDGYMIDAPTYGIPVGIHQVFWADFVGAVRIQ
jgi:peptidoglycan DL-endopeptidase CwlO